MPPREKTAYVKSLNHLADRYGSLEDKTIRRVQAMLKELRGEIAYEVTQLEGFEPYRLKRLQDTIGRLIDRFNQEAKLHINSSMKGAVEFGDQSVKGPMKRLGLDADKIEDSLTYEEREKAGLPPKMAYQVQVGPMGGITPQQALVAMDYSADLIKDISDPMRAQINKRIRLAIVGQKSPVDMMREITQVLGVQARTGVWKKKKDPVAGIAARAETDLRTELQRAYNLAHHSQQKKMDVLAKTQDVRVLKGWTATADMRTRRSHLNAHRKYSKDPIPVDEPFILISKVGKHSGTKYELMYPGDPNGPPHETINCRCKSYTTTDRIGPIGSSLDGRISQELKRRNK